MQYEWDADKSSANRQNRGFGFEIMENFEWNWAVLTAVQWEGEHRELWVGPIGNSLFAVVVTERDDTLRIISLRHASATEIRKWRMEFQNG